MRDREKPNITIENCHFEHIGGHAIDLCGTAESLGTVRIRGIKAVDVRGKAVNIQQLSTQRAGSGVKQVLMGTASNVLGGLALWAVTKVGG
jgi:hypothetical protein